MNLVSKATDKNFWKMAREAKCFSALRKRLLDEWERCGSAEIDELKYSDFKLFFTSGDRVKYQTLYSRRRTVLTVSALLSLLYPEKEEYIERLNDIIFAICNEFTWSLPAHIRGLNVNNSCRIDLFSAETGLYLAEIYKIFGDRIEPFVRDRIPLEIERRIFNPFETRSHEFNWELGSANWTSVCMGSVACTYILMCPDRAEWQIPRFNASMDTFLDGFSLDGVCFEGAVYWNYGMSFFTVYADMLREFTGGKIDYFKDTRVKRIYKFFENYFLFENMTISFSDSPSTCYFSRGRMHRAKLEYGDEISLPDEKYSSLILTRFSELLREFLWYEESFESDAKQDKTEIFASDAQWFIKRTKKYAVAAKGGHNSEPHNHNDIGSFIVIKDGECLLTDVGTGKYTRQYFSDKRYTLFEPSSRSHSVPIIDDEYQKFGKEFRARDVEFVRGVFSLDIAGAYGFCEGESIKRSFSFGDDKIIITDEFSVKKGRKIKERLVTKIEPKLDAVGTVMLGKHKILYDAEVFGVSVSKEISTVGGALISGAEIVENCYYLIDFTPTLPDVSKFEVKII